MKELYTIGEVSKLIGISSQTLRYYDKIGVVKPAFVNEATGYRRYTYDQINYIDRIKYLQDFGLSLDEIRSSLESNSVDDLVEKLEKHTLTINAEIKRLTEIKNDICSYIKYYRHTNDCGFNSLPFRDKRPDTYVLAEPVNSNEPIYGYAGYRLTQKKNSAEFKNCRFIRQNGYILDYKSLIEGKIVPTHYYIYMKEKPQEKHDGIIKIPAGNYFCLRSKILSDGLSDSPELIKNAADKIWDGISSPPIVIADEYEDNFNSFNNCIYEIQIHMPKDKNRE